jgi:hypothetical protein
VSESGEEISNLEMPDGVRDFGCSCSTARRGGGAQAQP